ncbi:hypothetical protein CIB48_g1857 [Xylaria polymorpha]|nr:hypothetical protein CIB48_g1857 [Xylaria polymorpha]
MSSQNRSKQWKSEQPAHTCMSTVQYSRDRAYAVGESQTAQVDRVSRWRVSLQQAGRAPQQSGAPVVGHIASSARCEARHTPTIPPLNDVTSPRSELATPAMASPADIMKARYGRGGFRPFLPGQMLLLSHAPDPDPDPAAVEMTMKLTITYPKDANPSKTTYTAGDRVDVDAHRVHEVWIGSQGRTMVIGDLPTGWNMTLGRTTVTTLRPPITTSQGPKSYHLHRQFPQDAFSYSVCVVFDAEQDSIDRLTHIFLRLASAGRHNSFGKAEKLLGQRVEELSVKMLQGSQRDEHNNAKTGQK